MIDKIINLLIIFKDIIQTICNVILGFSLGIISFVLQQRHQEDSEKRNALLAFRREIYRNALYCKIMCKDEYFRLFDVDCLHKIKTNDYLPLLKNIVMYMAMIEYANIDIAEFLEFKKWYTSDVSHRTQENEQTLEAKRSRLIDDLKRLETTIKEAEETLGKNLYELKIIKKKKEKTKDKEGREKK